MPQIPKPEALRQRRNRSSTKATLPSAAESADNEVPDLPGIAGGWHPMVAEWWASAWRSPMASEWLDSDMVGGMYEIAILRNDFWNATSPEGRRAMAQEIRLQEVRFGLSPIDRRRLQWEVEKGEQAAERTAGRRKAKAPAKPGKDPRDVLKLA